MWSRTGEVGDRAARDSAGAAVNTYATNAHLRKVFIGVIRAGQVVVGHDAFLVQLRAERNFGRQCGDADLEQGWGLRAATNFDGLQVRVDRFLVQPDAHVAVTQVDQRVLIIRLLEGR